MGALQRDREGRRVVLVLSDGKDAPGFRKFGEKFIGQLEIVDRAQREEVMIYGIGLRSRGARSMPMGGDLRAMLVDDLPDPALGTTALETGGGYFEIRPRDDLGAAFARVVEELHSQYLMGFAPSARDGKRHRIEVKLPGQGSEAARPKELCRAEELRPAQPGKYAGQER